MIDWIDVLLLAASAIAFVTLLVVIVVCVFGLGPIGFGSPPRDFGPAPKPRRTIVALPERTGEIDSVDVASAARRQVCEPDCPCVECVWWRAIK